jgi:hypothetical protein
MRTGVLWSTLQNFWVSVPRSVYLTPYSVRLIPFNEIASVIATDIRTVARSVHVCEFTGSGGNHIFSGDRVEYSTVAMPDGSTQRLKIFTFDAWFPLTACGVAALCQNVKGIVGFRFIAVLASPHQCGLYILLVAARNITG